MPYVPSDIFHAAADGVTILNFNERTLDEVPRQNSERSPLIKRMNVERIRTWIESGGDVNGEPDPALREATAFETDIISVVYPGSRLLSVAAECGRVDVMRLLLANGADMNYVQYFTMQSTRAESAIRGDEWSDGRVEWNLNALVQAAIRKRDVAVRLLIENGVDVNFAANNCEDAVLTLTTGLDSNEKSLRMLKMLLAAGADPRARNMLGRTAYCMARESLVRKKIFIEQIEQGGDALGHNYVDLLDERAALEKTFEILGGTAIAGGYKKYVILKAYPPAKDLLVLRALVCGSRRTVAGRAVAGPETPKAVARLFESCPDGVFWLVIKYWKLGNWYYPLVQEPRRKQPIPSSSPTSYYHSCLKEGWSAEDWSDDDDATTTP